MKGRANAGIASSDIRRADQAPQAVSDAVFIENGLWNPQETLHSCYIFTFCNFATSDRHSALSTQARTPPPPFARLRFRARCFTRNSGDRRLKRHKLASCCLPHPLGLLPHFSTVARDISRHPRHITSRITFLSDYVICRHKRHKIEAFNLISIHLSHICIIYSWKYPQRRATMSAYLRATYDIFQHFTFCNV